MRNRPLPYVYYFLVDVYCLGAFLSKVNQESTVYPCILVIFNGKGLINIRDQQYNLSRGSVVFLPSCYELMITEKPNVKLQGILIKYDCIISEAQPNIFKYLKPIQSCSLKILSMIEELKRVWNMEPKDKPFLLQQLFLNLLAELYDESKRTLLQTSPWMEQVIQYIDTHFQEDLTREQLSELAQVSPEHFSRTFRIHTGQTFSAYLALLRIRLSQQRLLYEMPKLDQLAIEVGYKEGTYLSRKFKQLVGLSPSAYYLKRKRVVVLNSNHTACLLALGVIPELGEYTTWLEKLNPVNEGRKINKYKNSIHAICENVASTQPDVIIDYNKITNYKNMLELAPILEIPFINTSWREQFRIIANVVDRQLQAESWLKQYDEIVLNFNRRLDEQLGVRGTAIVWEITETSAYCFHSSFGRGAQIIYEDIGFLYPVKLLNQKINEKGYFEDEIESIPCYPADHIFITGIPSNIEVKNRINRLFSSEIWLKMKAVQEKQVYILDKPDLFYGYDPLSSQAQLDVLMSVLISQK